MVFENPSMIFKNPSMVLLMYLIKSSMNYEWHQWPFPAGATVEGVTGRSNTN
jgi:hypothetical protein